MAKIFVTGSSTGLGLLAGQALLRDGHDVTLHARNAQRAADTGREAPGAEIITGDLSTIAGIRAVADAANRLGRFDAVIHNAALGYQEGARHDTADGLPAVFATNTLAPYLLTALMERPDRLVYLSSGMHRSAHASLDDLTWTSRRWNGSSAYAESKLHDLMLALAISRRWPDVLSNAVDPGWVPTRMGGRGAPDDLEQGYRTQAWLAAGTEPAARITGHLVFHLKDRATNPEAQDIALQDRLLARLAEIGGVALP